MTPCSDLAATAANLSLVGTVRRVRASHAVHASEGVAARWFSVHCQVPANLHHVCCVWIRLFGFALRRLQSNPELEPSGPYSSHIAADLDMAAAVQALA